MDHNTEQLITVYTPDPLVRNPFKVFAAMIRDLAASRELGWRLFIRDISAQYRQSMLGVFWTFLPPIITSLIFIALQSRRVINFEATSVPYPVYVLVGTLLWQIFTDSLNAPLKVTTAAKSFIVKIKFPHEALILSAFFLVIFNALIRVIILAVIFLAFRLSPTPGLLLAPLGILSLILLGIGLGLLLTPFGALYSDISSSLPIIVQIVFFVTPVVYPLPQSFPLSLLGIINPVSPLLIATRDMITLGVVSNPLAFSVVATLSLVLVIAGWGIYRVALPIVIERISA